MSLSLLCTAFAGILAASSLAALEPAPQIPSPTSTDLATGQAPMLERYGKPYVMVMVNGRGPFRFMIDTGTGTDAIITPELADLLALPAIGQISLMDPSGQGGRKVPLLQLQSLEVAGILFRNVRAVRHIVGSEAGTCDGLLGFTLFRNYLLTLDFPQKRFVLEQGSLVADGERNVLPFRMPDGVPLAKLKIDGLPPMEAQIDSGGGGLDLPENLAGRLHFDVAPIVYAEGRSLSTCFQLKAAKLASDVRLGRYVFPHPVVELHAAFPLPNLGALPLRNFAVTFDQRNLLVRFSAHEKRFKLTAPPAPTRLAMQPDAPKQTEPGLVPVG